MRRLKIFLMLAFVVAVFSTVLWAAETKWSAVTVQNDADDDDRILILDDPNGTPANFAVPRNYFLLDWAGSTNITSVGTIGTGTWQGTAIADAYIPNNITIDLASAVTTNANLTGDVTSVGNATDITETVLGVGGTDTIFPADPGADRVLMWDDDPGALIWYDISGAGFGDMLKATYDISGDGFVDGNDVAYSAAWDGDVNAPSMNAVYDKIEAIPASHDAVTYDTNMATLFTLTDQVVEVNLATPADGVTKLSTADQIYDWVIGLGYGVGSGDGDMTKAVYDVSADGFVDGNDVAFAAAWNGDVNAPSMNAVYDKFVALTLSDLTDMATTGTDPDVDASGELAVDTDGANEPNDVVLRTADTGGDTQYALAQVLKSIQGTVITPNDLADATRDALPIWENNTGMTFVITMIRAWSDTDDTTLNVETYDSAWANNATVDALEIASDGTANFYVEETTITAGTIAAGSLIVLDFDDTDDPGWVKFNIMGYFNADVD